MGYLPVRKIRWPSQSRESNSDQTLYIDYNHEHTNNVLSIRSIVSNNNINSLSCQVEWHPDLAQHVQEFHPVVHTRVYTAVGGLHYWHSRC